MNIGIVGIQGYGGTYLKVIAARPHDQVVALCDLDLSKLTKLADQFGVVHRFTDYREMLNLPDLDAVFIATPHFLHYPMVMAALRAGKDVFCEKPLAIESVHAEEMVRTANALGRTLTCHYNQRVRPYVVELRQIIRSGMIGHPYQINARWMARWTEFMFDARTSWRLQSAKYGGGIFIGRGSHLIDAVLYMLDFPKVHAVTATVHRRLTGGEVDDFASALLRIEGGVMLNVQCSYVAHSPAYSDRMEYEVFGTAGGASYLPGTDGQNSVLVGQTGMKDGTFRMSQLLENASQVSTISGYTIIDDFLDSIAQRRQPLVAAEQAAYVTRIIEAGYESAACEKEIALDR